MKLNEPMKNLLMFQQVLFGKITFTTGGSPAPAADARLRSRRLDWGFAPDRAPNGCESSFQ